MAPKKGAAAKKTAGGRVAKKAAAPKPAAKAAAPPADVPEGTVVVEACKSWGVFKRRAAELEKLVQEGGAPSATFVVNPDKPRKGTFEVRRGNKTYVSLEALPRPFKALRELDLEAVAAQLAADLK